MNNTSIVIDDESSGSSEASLGDVIDSGSETEDMARSDREYFPEKSGGDSVNDGIHSKIFGRLQTSIQSTPRRGYYISGVFKCGNDEKCKETIEQVAKRGSNCAYKFLIKHDDHWHIIHDCSFSNGQCRCFGIEFYTKSGRNKVRSEDLTANDWRHIIEYHLQSGREIAIYEIHQTDCSGLFIGYKNIRSEGDQLGTTSQEGRTMETCEDQSEIFRQRYGGRSYKTIDYQSDTSNGSTTRRQRKRRGRTTQDQAAEEISTYLKEICASPITDGDRTKQWVNSEWEYVNNLHRVMKNVKNNLRLKFSMMSFDDLHEFYQNRLNTPLWGAVTKNNFYDYYFDEKQSHNKVMQLLIYQLAPQSLDNTYYIKNDDWMAPVFNWLKDFLLFLDKKSGKTNAYYFISGSCSGKTFFMEMVKDYLLNTGNMSNWNRYSQFPLQMCVDKRVIFWNEPNCEPGAFEDLKKVLGGEYYSANIKNQDHAEIRRTPIIITGNPPYIFPKDEAFSVRIKQVNWTTAPFLKDNSSKKLHPYTFRFLIDLTENYYNMLLSEMKYNEIP